MISIDQRLVDPDITVIRVSGKITAGHSTQELASRVNDLMQSAVLRVVFDLSATDTLDSTGLGLLVTYGQNLKRSGGQMHLAGPVGPVARTLALCKIAEIIPIFSTLDEATSSFARSANAS